jgi:hypothetical protein
LRTWKGRKEKKRKEKKRKEGEGKERKGKERKRKCLDFRFKGNRTVMYRHRDGGHFSGCMYK